MPMSSARSTRSFGSRNRWGRAVTRKVDVYLGVASRYSYLASTQLAALQADTGCALEWRMLFTGDLVGMTGVNPFKGAPVSGQYNWDYRRYDAECWADYYGVPYREPPHALIHDYDLLRRLALAATAAARLGVVERYAPLLYNAIFNAQPTPFGDTVLLGLAEQCGCETQGFKAAMEDEATAELLRATTQKAHDRGAFGLPAFFVDDRMYWGNDRLVLLRHYLLRE